MALQMRSMRCVFTVLLALCTTSCISYKTAGNHGFARARFELNGTPLSVTGARVVVHEDGRVFSVGSYSGAESAGIAVAAFSPRGVQDMNFGSGGTALWDYESGVLGRPVGAFFESGSLTVVAPAPPSNVARVRINLETGDVLDARVSDSGLLDFPAHDAKLDHKGRILVSGCTPEGPNTSKVNTALARFAPDFSLDPSFGDGGTSVKNVSADWSEWGFVVQSVGDRIYVFSAPRDGPVVLRFRDNGEIDSEFANGGQLRLSSVLAQGLAFRHAGHGALVVDTNANRLLIAGALGVRPERDLSVVAISLDNFELDAGFGVEGIAKVDFEDVIQLPSDDLASVIALDNQHRIVVAGFSIHWPEAESGEPALRFSTDVRLTQEGAVEIGADKMLSKRLIMIGEKNPAAISVGVRAAPHNELVFLGDKHPEVKSAHMTIWHYR